MHPGQVHVRPVAQHQHVLEPLRGRDELGLDAGAAAIHQHLVVLQQGVDRVIFVYLCFAGEGHRLRVLGRSLRGVCAAASEQRDLRGRLESSSALLHLGALV